MAVISTRGTLNDAITAYLGRGDMTAYYDLWVQQAEKFIERRLRTEETRTTITVNSADDSALPALYRTIRALRIVSPVGERPLILVTAEHLERLRAEYAGATGMPRYAHPNAYAGTLSVAPAPDASYSAVLVYKQGINPLGPLTTDFSNTLTEHPDLYLYAVLREACVFLEDPRAPEMEKRVDEILHWIRVTQEELESSGAPQPAPLPTHF